MPRVLLLDERTLIFVAAVFPLFLATVLAIARTLRPVPAGFGAWALSQLAFTAGAGMVAIRGALPLWLSVVGGNALLMIGAALLPEGFRRFYGLPRRFPRWLDPALILATLAGSAAMSGGPANGRIALWSAVVAFYLARTALEPLASPEPRGCLAQRILSALELGAAGLLLFRAVRAAGAPPFTDLFAEGWTMSVPVIALTLVNATAMYVALVLGFDRAERQLRQALSEVKALTGLLPICMHCHRIRNDRGYWDQLERYLAQHTDARFSHGICPSCYEEKYAGEHPPGLFEPPRGPGGAPAGGSTPAR